MSDVDPDPDPDPGTTPDPVELLAAANRDLGLAVMAALMAGLAGTVPATGAGGAPPATADDADFDNMPV